MATPPILLINGVPYQVILGNPPMLRLWNTHGDEYTDLKGFDQPGVRRTYTLPASPAIPGIKSQAICDEQGQLEIQEPSAYTTKANYAHAVAAIFNSGQVAAHLDALGSKINEIFAILTAHWIMYSENLVITPGAAVEYLSAVGPNEVGPLGSAPEVLSTIAPTIILGSIIITPSPAIFVEKTINPTVTP